MAYLSPFFIESNETMVSAIKRFVNSHPSYLETSAIDELRSREFRRLSTGGVYMDYTGAGLYPESLVYDHAQVLASNVFGNPHSASPSSMLSSTYVHAARVAVLNFFDADPEDYDVVFTPNASGALRIVGESYPFTKGTSDHLILPLDAHNSVNGLREFAVKAGAKVKYMPIKVAWRQRFYAPSESAGGLFVLTGQSNLSGLKGNLNLLADAKSQGYDTLLDAAALAPSTAISLRSLNGSVDALAISLYKLIGYPTGVGCLVARKEFLAKLRKPWFSGGSVLIVQSPNMGRLLLEGHERWEDGTVNFLSLIAVPRGLQILNNHLPVMAKRLPLLMHFTLSSLASLKHANGAPLIELHSPSSPDAYSPYSHGAVISMSFLRPTGVRVPPHDVEHRASAANIHVRAGCLCNPGAASCLLGRAKMLNEWEIHAQDSHGNYDTPASVQESYAANKHMERLIREEGVVRISFGLASAISDAAMFIDFARGFFGVNNAVPKEAEAVAPKLRMKTASQAEMRREQIQPTRKRSGVLSKLRSLPRMVLPISASN